MVRILPSVAQYPSPSSLRVKKWLLALALNADTSRSPGIVHITPSFFLHSLPTSEVVLGTINTALGIRVMSTAVNSSTSSSTTSIASLSNRQPPFSKEERVAQQTNNMTPGYRSFFDKSPEGTLARQTYLKVFFGGTFMVIVMIFTILPMYWGALWKIPTRNLPGWVVVRAQLFCLASLQRGLMIDCLLISGLRWWFDWSVGIASFGFESRRLQSYYVDGHPCYQLSRWTPGVVGRSSE